MAFISFDDFDAGDRQTKANDKPIWQIKLDDPETEPQVLKWLLAEVQFIQDNEKERQERMHRNVKVYKGISEEVIGRDFNRDVSGDRSRVQRKIVVNHLFDLTEQKVSRLVKYRPGIAVLPTNDEMEDRQAADVAKLYWDHIKYIQRFDKKIEETLRKSYIDGQSYFFVLWNKELGGQVPEQKALESKGQKVPLLDDNGNPMKDDSGNVSFVDKVVNLGDIEFKIVRAVDVFEQIKKEHHQVEYLFLKEVVDTESLKQEFPDKQDKIRSEKEKDETDSSRFERVKLNNQVIKWTFFHKGTKELRKGRQITFTRDTILENIDLPYEHLELPMERFDDIEVPGEQHAISFYEHTKIIANQINHLTTMITRNQKLAAHPKWFVPKGAVKLEQLNNDVSIVQYSGATPPQLAQANPTPMEVFKFREELKLDLQQIAGVYGVSRGEPPPGIKAGVALQFLAEQENERQNSTVLKFNEFIQKLAIKTIKTAAQYYFPDDQRQMLVLGKDSEWKSRFIDPQMLGKPFDIRVQNSSALPESKSARIQTILDLSERYPDLITSEQVLDLLDWSQSEKLIDEATAATKKATAENEMMGDGDVIVPNKWELHIQHWRVHQQFMQSNRFTTLPRQAQKQFVKHVLAHEMFMYEISKLNPMFSEKLAMLPQFPLIFVPDTAPSTVIEGELAEEQGTEQAMQQQNLERPVQAFEGQPMPTQDIAQAPPMQVQGEPINPQ